MEALQEFVQKLAAFRKAHPVIRKAEPMHLNDYQHKGCPDLSYHSDNAWAAGLPEEKGAFGVMYCGDYAVNDAGEPDDMVYIGYNFHTGVNELACRNLPGRRMVCSHGHRRTGTCFPARGKTGGKPAQDHGQTAVCRFITWKIGSQGNEYLETFLHDQPS